MVTGKYYEEFNVGDKFITPRRTITKAAIDIMLSLGGLRNPVFVDEEYAKTTVFGSSVVPGELSIVFMGGLNEQLDMWWDTVLVGIDKMKFKNPLRPGDTIHNEIEILSTRLTSKQGWGLVLDKSTCLNQKGQAVAELEFIHLVPCKTE